MGKINIKLSSELRTKCYCIIGAKIQDIKNAFLDKGFHYSKEIAVGTLNHLDCEGHHLICYALEKDRRYDIQDIEIIGAKLYDFCTQGGMEDIDLNILDEEKSIHIIKGIMYRSYSFDKYKSDIQEKNLNVNLYVSKVDKEKLEEYVCLFKFLNFSRDWVNEPANVLYPAAFIEEIKTKTPQNVKIDILDETTISKKQLNLITAIGSSSANKPFVAELVYKGNIDKDDYEVIVGKGITYDTGGVSLKTSSSLSKNSMKTDMAGAATAWAVISALAANKAKVNVCVLLGIAENVLGSSSIKPGDIFKSHSGKYVEIVNTDAEGRIVMADLLSYAQEKYKISNIIDIATLTGNAAETFSGVHSCLYSNNNKLSRELLVSSVNTGDLLWGMPLHKNYSINLTSKVADIRNYSPNGGTGANTAACFLNRFIKEGVSWAHIDIASTSFNNDDVLPKGYGATASGVLVLYNYLERISKQ